MKTLLISIALFTTIIAKSQTYPSFGPEIDVTITGLTFDAMEPFISADGNYLFFNNLNDGVNTKLFYASKINDSTFNFVGEINGPNQIAPPYLDAVADMDSLNGFYWTSTRDYPFQLDNLFHGNFSAGNVTSIGRVHGNFNKNIPGWLIMDHGISYDGEFLYYNNAKFDSANCQGPCVTEMGIAQKVNDSTFNQIPNSIAILQNVTDTNFIFYAPCISSDNLELYYTRYPRDTITVNTLFEICVAVRNSPTDNFSVPTVLFSDLIEDLIEAATLTADKEIIYYHRKIIGSHKIVMRYRESALNTSVLSEQKTALTIYPNPTNGNLYIQTDSQYEKIKLSVLNLLGAEVIAATDQEQVDVKSIPEGTYFVKVEIDGKVMIKRFLKNK